jgi:hypothetical protein
MSLAWVVAAVGHAASTLQGACHRCLHLWWWPLPNLQPAPPSGPTIDVFNFGGGHCRTCRQHPQGAHHRPLQLRWWPLSDLPPAPPRGPTIGIFNFGGGRCRTYLKHPLRGPPLTSSTSVVAAAKLAARTPKGAHRRRLQLQWWLLPNLPPAPPGGPAIDVFGFGGGRCRTCRQHQQWARH